VIGLRGNASVLQLLNDHFRVLLIRILLHENARENGSGRKQQNIGRRREPRAMARVSCLRLISGSRCSSVEVCSWHCLRLICTWG
jgi:hypothetical protein